MKNYETGICAVCKQPKDDHYKKCEEQKDGPCQLPNVHCQFPICVKPLGHDFKDSGLAQLEKNAPKLLEAIQQYREAVNKWGSLNPIGLEECARTLWNLDEAINEALKR